MGNHRIRLFSLRHQTSEQKNPNYCVDATRIDHRQIIPVRHSQRFRNRKNHRVHLTRNTDFNYFVRLPKNQSPGVG